MPRIDHVVVLMLENRSFDTMLGWLYPTRPDFDGLTGQESNPLTTPTDTTPVPVWTSPDITAEAACIPDPDPGELFEDITTQIYGLNRQPPAPPTMTGFVDNYARHDPPPSDPAQVMHCFSPEQLPVITSLARAFGVSDRWFSSAPCQTWPNRLFAHTGTAGGRVDNWAIPLPLFLRSVFRRLERHGHQWRVYFHDLPQTAALFDLWTRIPTHFRLFNDEFLQDAAAGRLPAYSFIEPRYYPSLFSGQPPNDEHPPHNLLFGEQLIAATYNALRNGPAWERTLFVVTFDEHGGCYDHVPPPPATPPGGPYPDGFRFDRFGVRVPTVVASPWIPAGSILRPPSEGAPFDHTSIIATLHHLFDLGPEPTPRVAAAPDLLSVLTLTGPDNPGPERLSVSAVGADKCELRALRRLPRNNHQKRLRHPAVLIPALAAQAAAHLYGHLPHRRRTS